MGVKLALENFVLLKCVRLGQEHHNWFSIELTSVLKRFEQIESVLLIKFYESYHIIPMPEMGKV